MRVYLLFFFRSSERKGDSRKDIHVIDRIPLNH